MPDRVFDDRVGLIVVPAGNLTDKLRDRLPRIAAFGGGLIRDVFLPRQAAPSDLGLVREHGLYAHLWVATDGLTARALATRTLDDIARLRPGACELNLELPDDDPLPGYIRDVVSLIRERRPNYRLRVNVAPWKGFALPRDLLASDPALFASEQNYEGNMANLLSPLDVWADAADDAAGVPLPNVTVCYAAACRVHGSNRVRTLPDLARVHRGAIFSDDLMAEVGLFL